MLEGTSLMEVSLQITAPPKQRTETPQRAHQKRAVRLLGNGDKDRLYCARVHTRHVATVRCERMKFIFLPGCECSLVLPAPRQPRAHHHSSRYCRFGRV